MKCLNAQRGKNLKASFAWVQFTLHNIDIMTALISAPLRVERVNRTKYAGKVFGVRLTMEVVQDEHAGNRGTMRVLSDIRLPFGLGRTYTVVSQSYYSVDEKTTSLDLDLTIELTRIMRLYVLLRRDAIDSYLNRICTDVENASLLLEAGEPSALQQLTKDQLSQVEQFRAGLSSVRPGGRGLSTNLRGILRVTMAQDMLMVTAEAKMPDQHLLNANERLSLDASARGALLEGTRRLARINNRAFAVRGTPSEEVAEDAEFHQAAFEFGHSFYRTVCAGQLTGIVPIVISHGETAALYIVADGSAEELPWEAMHDGNDFLALRVRLCRSVAAIPEVAPQEEKWAPSGILMVGANAKGDIPGAEAEAENIGQLLRSAGVTKVEVLRGSSANRAAVIHALMSGEFNILHFSGHSAFDSSHPFQSFLELYGQTKLFLHELGSLGRGRGRTSPLDLAFLNSCQSAKTGQDRITGRQLSMCRALREAGVGHVIGMLWNVEDTAAVQVGSTFYNCLLANPHLGPEEAMRMTRKRVSIDRAWADGSWLAPVLYV